MFDREISGRYQVALFLDLDIIVTGSLDGIIDRARHSDGLLIAPKFHSVLWRWFPEPFWRRFPALAARATRGNSSVVCFVPSRQFHLFDEFDPAKHRPEYKNDQNYISEKAANRGLLPKGYCVELIKTVPHWPVGRVLPVYRKKPKQAKIIIFNGDPKPFEFAKASIAHWGSRSRRAYGKLEWVAENLARFGYTGS